jgi:hypothetical protein
MTGRLILRVETDPHVKVSSGAVVSLQRVPSGTSNGAGAAIPRVNVSLTPEQGRNGREIDIPPGRWFVEATLGSGDVVSEMVDLGEGASAVVVLPLPDTSPHEWLGWQFNSGNVEGSAALDRLIAQAREMTRQADETYRVRARARLLQRRLKESAKSGAFRLARGLDSLRGRFDPEGRISRVIDSVQSELRRAASDATPIVRVVYHPRLPDDEAGSWLALLGKLNERATISDPIRSSPEERIFIYRFGGEAPPGSRRFVEAEWDGERCRLVLPEPWISISDGHPTGSELLLRKHPLDGSLRASLAVLDPDFSTLAALMMTSAMPKAAVFVDENADLIFAQTSLAGAAAAYVALSSGRVEGRLLAHIREFERSRMYPDCLAIAAWRMIRFPESHQQVRPAIMGAFRAGPPFFSIGVGWVLDALTMLGPDDAQAVAYADIVKQVAIKLDTSQVFTTVRGRPADLKPAPEQ